MPLAPTLLWFRQDLRLADNAAFAAALARGGAVIPVFIYDPDDEGDWPPGPATQWWLQCSLKALADSLTKRGSRLIIRQGVAREILPQLARETGAKLVVWNRRYEPAAQSNDACVAQALECLGCEVSIGESTLLFSPDKVANKQGKPYQVFTPFWRHCQAQPIAEPVSVPGGKIPSPTRWPETLAVESLTFHLENAATTSYARHWTPGEAGAQGRLRLFLKRHLDAYDTARDVPSAAGTSGLSPHLHFGEIGPRQIWAAVRASAGTSGVFPSSRGMQRFLVELGWREFAYHLLAHFPHTPEQPLRQEFAAFPWADDPDERKLHAWCDGQTGYPIVDAGMRELRTTGWMHNRVRMITASFLVKHLRLPWTQGAAWFWSALVDADLAANTLGWQWSAGCGADAAPYFRIFNPVLQGQKFDPQGAYVRRWVPELTRLPDTCLHAPWTAPAAVLATAGVRLGRDYPAPLVDHATARREALAALQTLRRSRNVPS